MKAVLRQSLGFVVSWSRGWCKTQVAAAVAVTVAVLGLALAMMAVGCEGALRNSLAFVREVGVGPTWGAPLNFRQLSSLLMGTGEGR